jgi:hypothetical protein
MRIAPWRSPLVRASSSSLIVKPAWSFESSAHTAWLQALLTSSERSYSGTSLPNMALSSAKRRCCMSSLSASALEVAMVVMGVLARGARKRPRERRKIARPPSSRLLVRREVRASADASASNQAWDSR